MKLSKFSPFSGVRKVSNSQNINMSYIILKQVIWRLRTYNLFCEIFKFHDFREGFLVSRNLLSTVCRDQFRPSKMIGGGGGWGGTFISYSAKVCIIFMYSSPHLLLVCLF